MDVIKKASFHLPLYLRGLYTLCSLSFQVINEEDSIEMIHFMLYDNCCESLYFSSFCSNVSQSRYLNFKFCERETFPITFGIERHPSSPSSFTLE